MVVVLEEWCIYQVFCDSVPPVWVLEVVLIARAEAQYSSNIPKNVSVTDIYGKHDSY